MDSIYFDFSPLHLIEGLSQSVQIKRGDVRERLAEWLAGRTLQPHSLNFITITVLRLNQFISGNIWP